MPRKSDKGEYQVQDYVPAIEPRQTVEVAVGTLKEGIERIESPSKRFKRAGGAGSGASRDREEAGNMPKPPKTLSGDSVLIITEKPQAADKIAAALSGGRAARVSAGAGVPYYEFQSNSENVIVACAVGHLFSLGQNARGSGYPVFDISWKPNFEIKKNDFTRRYYNSLAKLVSRAKEIIIATDYDAEGEVIGYNIARFIAGQPDAKRMKFSSLTADEIRAAYKSMYNSIDWGQAIAGETRHYLDWFYGINLSRALMNSIRAAGRFRIMSIGRVQGPALNLVVQKEKKIQAFKPEPFWKIFLNLVDRKDNKIQAKYAKEIKDKGELSKFEGLKGKEAIVSTKKSVQTIPPLPPFDLTSLQIEAYKFFSFSPAQTLQIAQQLYLAGLISYPRTSSQKIPISINPKAIISRLSSKYPQTRLITRAKPVEGKKTDPAHPSIYPTGEFQELDSQQKKLYELLVKRFIACFCSNAKVENKTITAEINGLKFSARGLEVQESGWTQVYEARMQEKEIRDMNGGALIENVEIAEDQTKPPKRYSPASIVSELEKRGLGTKATRAAIIETLYSRNYIADSRSIKATPLGMQLIESLSKYSPIIINEKLTREMEKEIERILLSKNKSYLEKERDNVLSEAKKVLSKISDDFHKNEQQIGKELSAASENLWKQEREENEIGACPICKQGALAIRYSPKFKRKFVACSAYPKCKTTFSLPPTATSLKKTGKSCPECGFPMLMSFKKGRRPWTFCFNPQCPTNKEWREKREQAKKDEESSETKQEENEK